MPVTSDCQFSVFYIEKCFFRGIHKISSIAINAFILPQLLVRVTYCEIGIWRLRLKLQVENKSSSFKVDTGLAQQIGLRRIGAVAGS